MADVPHKEKTDVVSEDKQAKQTRAAGKGKQPAKRSHDDPVQSTSGEAILTMLHSIQATQKASDAKFDNLAKRMDCLESYEEYEDYGDFNPIDGNENELTEEGEIDEPPCAKAPKVVSDTSSSRFSGLSKRFKSVDFCGEDIDDVLASTLTDLFRKGMDPEQYDDLIKDENTPRPKNCDGLVVVKMNKLVWDVMSQTARSNDRKLQNCGAAIVKSGVIMAKAVDEIAKLEQTMKGSDPEHAKVLGTLIENCNDALSLLGHANFQTNMARRDFLKPELRKEYGHLCTHSVPYTNELFGDDVSKTAKEIEDCAKLGHKMQTGYKIPFRGRANTRGRFRGRGSGPYRGRGYQAYGSSPNYFASRQDDRKNGVRRGNSNVPYRSARN